MPVSPVLQRRALDLVITACEQGVGHPVTVSAAEALAATYDAQALVALVLIARAGLAELADAARTRPSEMVKRIIDQPTLAAREEGGRSGNQVRSRLAAVCSMQRAPGQVEVSTVDIWRAHHYPAVMEALTIAGAVVQRLSQHDQTSPRQRLDGLEIA
jgi:malonyl CoA-acyl carrier protein transacylase